jgi:hypothetical protein
MGFRSLRHPIPKVSSRREGMRRRANLRVSPNVKILATFLNSANGRNRKEERLAYLYRSRHRKRASLFYTWGPMGENVLITCQRTERSSSLAHSSPSGQPGPCQVAPDVVGGRHTLVYKLSPPGRELLCLIKFFGIISLLERSRGYPRRYSHSTVDAAVRLPYRNTETRKRPKTKVRPGTRFTPPR